MCNCVQQNVSPMSQVKDFDQVHWPAILVKVLGYLYLNLGKRCLKVLKMGIVTPLRGQDLGLGGL